MKVLWSLPLLLFWSLLCLYLSSKFCIFALHWFPVWMDPMPCSLSSLFSSQTIDFQLEELCRLLMGWWSLHTHFRNPIFASDQLEEQFFELTIVLMSTLEFSRVEIVGKVALKSSSAFWNVEMVGQFACELGCALTTLNSGCGCQQGKMHSPHGVSLTKGCTRVE